MNMATAMAVPTKPLRLAELSTTMQSQLTPSNWLLRAMALVAVGVVGFVAVTHTAAYQIRSQRPELANELAPYDGRIAALAAAYRSAPGATSENRRAGDGLAVRALRLDPTAVVAVSTIGLNAQVRGDTPQARRTFAYAGFLSRGEMQTQLWAIEDAVGRGSVVDALQHYDIALRSTPSLFQMLFPPLTSASADPEIQNVLIRKLVAKPSWGTAFVVHIAANTTDPKSAAQLFKNLRQAGVAVPDDARAYLISSLLSHGLVEDAWSYYATLSPSADRRKSRDPRFLEAMDPPSPFDWILGSGEGVSSSIQRARNGGVLDFAAPSMAGGPIIQQEQVLPLGHYTIRGHSVGIDHNAGGDAYWSLRCKGGAEIGVVNVPDSRQSHGNFFGRFEVPAGCPIQILSMVVRPSEDIAGISGQIDFVQLEPAL
jgi:hypothetical protein